MEMTLTVHVPRRRPRPVDVVVEWVGEHTAADLCMALADHLGEAVPCVTSRGRPVDAATVVGVPPLVDGASVAVVTGPVPPDAGRAVDGVLELVAVSGPDAGRSRPLVPPGVLVGRSTRTGLDLVDDGLSRVHARFEVGPAGVTVQDTDSTNGVLVDGSRIATETPVDAASTIVVGSTTLRIRRAAGHGLPVGCPGDGTLVVRPAAAPAHLTEPVAVECPVPPPERLRQRIPWVAAVAPVPVAVALAVFLGPQLLLFAVFGPVVLLATTLGDRWGAGRSHRRALENHDEAVRAARARLGHALAQEAARLHRAHPDPHAVLTTAEHRLPGLWAGGEGLCLRIGLGAVATTVTWVEGSATTNPLVDGAPVTVDLVQARSFAVVGPEAHTRRLLTGLVGQLCTAHAPGAVSIAMASSDPSWHWASRVPQATGVAELLSPVGAAAAPGHRVLVVPSAKGGAAGVASLASRARDAGVLVVVAVSERSHIPAACGAILCAGEDGRHVLEVGDTATSLTVDLVGSWWGDRVSRALAPLRVRDGSPGHHLPRSVSLPDALGVEEISPEYVLTAWLRGAHSPGGPAPAPVAVVGTGVEGAFAIDLRRDGPHVLIGGTTGSGKSEFLRTLVTSLAVACPPEDLTFVLVDFKGGAAFGACTALPHVVGLVTDLDEHLVTRALASLGAELRRRERVFAAAGVRDLDAYRAGRRPTGEPVPRLVVVIDELRALVDEVPQFVSGLVRLAALGRSLGVHLVLATQRPAGAVTAEIQANVNLRIAFRVRDRADSVDILEDPSAAQIRSDTPGRGLCRGGDGALVSFHAATVEGPPVAKAPHLRVRAPGSQPVPAAPSQHPPEASSRLNAALRSSPVSCPTGSPAVGPALEDSSAGASAGVVAAVLTAHRRRGGADPRPPWLPPLPSRIPCPTGVPGSVQDPAAAVGSVGLIDEPEQQRISTLGWSPTDGTWLLAGHPGSGRTTALRSLVLAAAGRLGPHDLHVHVLDPTCALTDLERLPHLGTRIGPDRWRGLSGLLTHLRAEVDHRRASTRSTRAEEGRSAEQAWPVTLVVVDGWEQLLEAQSTAGPEDPLAGLVGVLRDGHSVGVLGAVSGGRGLLQPRWAAVGAHTFLLGAVDPLDAALTGLRAADLPHDPPPGRAVRVRDRREVQFVSSAPADTTRVGAATGSRPATGGAWRWRALPSVARRVEVLRVDPRRATTGSDAVGSPLGIGLAAPGLAVCSWRAEEVGRRLLVAGPPGSGRTNTVRVLAESARAVGRPAVVVTCAATPGPAAGFAGSTPLGSGDADTLVALRRRHPDLVVLVDDADRLGEDAPVTAVLREIVDLVDRDGGLVAVTTASSSLVTRFRGLDIDIARHRTGILLDPGPGDGDVLGVRLRDNPPRLPGRGVLVSRGTVTELQVFLADGSAVGEEFLADGSAVGVAPGHDLGVRLPRGQGSQARDEGQHDDEPAHEGAGSLDEAPPDGQQQGAPHDRRGPRPRGPTEPAAGDEAQSHASQQDEQGGHEHPGGVAALTDGELVDVEGGEAHEDQGLHPDEQRSEAAGAA